MKSFESGVGDEVFRCKVLVSKITFRLECQWATDWTRSFEPGGALLQFGAWCQVSGQRARQLKACVLLITICTSRMLDVLRGLGIKRENIRGVALRRKLIASLLHSLVFVSSVFHVIA